MEKNKKSLNILMISSGYYNIFQNYPIDFIAKLERDNLKPEINYFLNFTWSSVDGYHEEMQGRFKRIHIKTRWRKFKPLTDFLTIFLAPRCVKKYNFKPDIILIYDFGYVPAAILLRKIYKCPIVLGVLNMPRVYSSVRRFGLVKSFYSAFLERSFFKFVDLYYTINYTMKDYLIKLGAPAEKIFIFASNTISRDLANIAQAKKNQIRQKYDIKEDQKIILSIGRMEAEKGYPELFQLFSKLNKKFILIILGRGSMMEKFKKMTRELGIADRVIFVGYINRQEIWSYYQDADIFCLLSKAEALGLVFWEAMYMGVPVIGSTAAGIVETIGKDGERGFIYDKNKDDIDSFKTKINFCLEDSEPRKIMLDQARKYVEEQIANELTINDIV